MEAVVAKGDFTSYWIQDLTYFFQPALWMITLCSVKSWKVPLFVCYYFSQIAFVCNCDLDEDQTTVHE